MTKSKQHEEQQSSKKATKYINITTTIPQNRRKSSKHDEDNNKNATKRIKTSATTTIPFSSSLSSSLPLECTPTEIRKEEFIEEGEEAVCMNLTQQTIVHENRVDDVSGGSSSTTSRSSSDSDSYCASIDGSEMENNDGNEETSVVSPSLAVAESAISSNNDDTTSSSSSESSSSSAEEEEDNNMNQSIKIKEETAWSPMDINKIQSKSYMISIHNQDQELGFIGKAKIILYHGCIDVFGYTLQKQAVGEECTAKHYDMLMRDEEGEQPLVQKESSDGDRMTCIDIHNSIYLPVITIRNNNTDNATCGTSSCNCGTSIFKISFETKHHTILGYAPLTTTALQEQQQERHQPPPQTASLLHIPSTWKDTVSSIISSKQPQKHILICGMEGTGKKIMFAYIVNRLLSHQLQQQHNSQNDDNDVMSVSSHSDSNNDSEEEDTKNIVVYTLDVNVEHPCMGLPGIITLSSTSYPLLSPPYERSTNTKLLYSSFYGYKRPKDNLTKYTSCIQSCMNYYHQHISSSHPLIIITHGWIFRMGYEIILPNVIHSTNPFFLIQLGDGFTLQRNVQLNRILFSIPPYPKEGTMKNHYFIMEVFWFIAYFLGRNILTNISNIISISSNTGKIKDTHCSTARMLSSMKPFVISIHAVTIIINDDYESMEHQKNIFPIMNGSFIALLSSYNNSTTISQRSACVGLGIIRSVDPINELLYIISPLSLQEIQRVDMICKFTNVSIPFPILYLGNDQQRQPYIHVVHSDGGMLRDRKKVIVGAKAMNSRKHYKRQIDLEKRKEEL